MAATSMNRCGKARDRLFFTGPPVWNSVTSDKLGRINLLVAIPALRIRWRMAKKRSSRKASSPIPETAKPADITPLELAHLTAHLSRSGLLPSTDPREQIFAALVFLQMCQDGIRGAKPMAMSWPSTSPRSGRSLLFERNMGATVRSFLSARSCSWLVQIDFNSSPKN